MDLHKLPVRRRATGSRPTPRSPWGGSSTSPNGRGQDPSRKLRFRRSESPRSQPSPTASAPEPSSSSPSEAPIDERLGAILAPDETTQVVVATDIDQDGNFGEQLVVATNKRLLVVHPGSSRADCEVRSANCELAAEGQAASPGGTSRHGPPSGTTASSSEANWQFAIRNSQSAGAPVTSEDIELEVPLEKIAEVRARDLVGAGELEIKVREEAPSSWLLAPSPEEVQQRTEGPDGSPPAARSELGARSQEPGAASAASNGYAKVAGVRFTRSLVDTFNEAAGKIEDLARENGAALVEEDERKEVSRRGRSKKARCQECNRVLPPGSEICPACLPRKQIVLRMTTYIRPYLGLVVLSFVATLMVTLINLSPPMMMRALTDGALAPKEPQPMAAREHLLWLIVVLLFVQRVGSSIFGAMRTWLNGYLGQRIIFDVRSQVYQHLQTLSIGFYDKKSVGSLMSNVTSDTSVLHGFCVDGLQNILVNVMTLIGIGVTLFLMDWQLALIVLVPTPLLVFGSQWFSAKLRPLYRRYYREWAQISGLLASTFSGVRVVKGFVQEERETDRFIEKIRSFMGISLSTTKMYTIYGPTISLLLSVGSVLIWAIGGYHLIHGIGHITLGTLTAFTAYMWQFYAPIGSLCDLNNQIQNACTAAERVFMTLDTEPEIRDAPDAVQLPHIEGRIEFKGVNFYYDRDSGEPTLSHINLNVEPGELIGLVGPSGSGKTTLVNLLMRFYDPTDGGILLDGVDLRQLKVGTLRREIGFVSQEPFMFSGTITENIAYGRPDASFPEILEAAMAANAHGFIMNFPDAYNTEVGERGVRLSGGEKQRISIARAILNNPRILVLDEATSAVDTETEALIQEAMDRLMQGRTAFAIAHRLSTLKSANRLVVLERGKIAEVGTHQELLDKEDGVYARLVRIQSEMHRSVAV